MITTKTFSDIIAEGYEYPDIIPEDLQSLIFDWYQYRHVCDDDKFVVFFNRLLKKDYPRYYQLLRIEPGVAQYDWLVSKYKELQREVTDSRTDSAIYEGTTQGEETNSVDQDITKTTTHNTTDTNNGSRTNNLEKTIDEATTKDDSVTSTRQDVTDTDTTGHTINDVKMATRSLPMSTGGITTAQDGTIIGLDWSTGSAQTQTTTEENNSGTVDTTLTVNGTDSLDSEGTRNVTETTTGGYTDTATKTKTGTETNVTDGTIGSEKTVSSTKSDESTKTSAGTGRIREIETGRDNQIALTLQNAKDFIMSTNAWEWLMSRIDTVFMGVYDI